MDREPIQHAVTATRRKKLDEIIDELGGLLSHSKEVSSLSEVLRDRLLGAAPNDVTEESVQPPYKLDVVLSLIRLINRELNCIHSDLDALNDDL